MKWILLALMVSACGPTVQVADYLNVPKVEYTLSCKKVDCGNNAIIELNEGYAPGYVGGSCTWHCANFNGSVQSVTMTVWITENNGELCFNPDVDFTTAPCFSGGL